MPTTPASFLRSRAMTSSAVASRSPRGFRVMNMRPLLTVDAPMPPPMKEANRGHRRVVQDDLRHLLLQLLHGDEGDILGGVGSAHDDAGVLLREEAFRHGEVKQDCGHERQEPHAEGEEVMAQHPLEPGFIMTQEPVEGRLEGRE